MTTRTSAASAFGVRFTAPLISGTLLNPVNTSLIATAMVGIGVDFHRGPADTAILISVLYLCSAVAQPTMGKLGPVLGERRVFLAGVVIVLIAGVVGAFAWNFWLLVLSRALLGIGTSAAYPMSMSLIRARADAAGTGVPRRVLGVFAIVGQVIAVIGLPVGGLLTGLLGWRAVFAINIPLAALSLVLLLRGVPRDARERPHDLRRTVRAVDPLGIVLFSVVIVAALECARASEAVLSAWLGVGAVIGLVLLVAWELRVRSPLIDVRMLTTNRPLVITYLRQMLSALGMYLTMYGTSQWMEDSAGFSPAHVGLILLPMSVVSICVAQINSRLGGVRAPLLGAGAMFAAAGLVMLMLDHRSPLWALLLMSLLIGLANGLNGFANQSALYVQAPADQVGVASGLFRTFAYIGAIVSAALIGAAFGDHASDAGFHVVAWVTVGIGALVAVLTLADRTLPATV